MCSSWEAQVRLHTVVEPQPADRRGDIVAACAGDTAIMSSKDFPFENKLIGMHGSLTPDEMLVPFLVD